MNDDITEVLVRTLKVMDRTGNDDLHDALLEILAEEGRCHKCGGVLTEECMKPCRSEDDVFLMCETCGAGL